MLQRDDDDGFSFFNEDEATFNLQTNNNIINYDNGHIMDHIPLDDSLLLQLENFLEEIDLHNEDDDSASNEDDDENDYSLVEGDEDPASGEQDLAVMIDNLVSELQAEIIGRHSKISSPQEESASSSAQSIDEDVEEGDAVTNTPALQSSSKQSIQDNNTSAEGIIKSKLKADEEIATRLNEELEYQSQLEVSSSGIFRAKFEADQVEANRINEELFANIQSQQQGQLEENEKEEGPSLEFIIAKLEADQAEAARINDELVANSQSQQKEQLQMKKEEGPSSEFLRAKFEADQVEANRIQKELDKAAGENKTIIPTTTTTTNNNNSSTKTPQSGKSSSSINLLLRNKLLQIIVNYLNNIDQLQSRDLSNIVPIIKVSMYPNDFETTNTSATSAGVTDADVVDDDDASFQQLFEFSKRRKRRNTNRHKIKVLKKILLQQYYNNENREEL